MKPTKYHYMFDSNNAKFSVGEPSEIPSDAITFTMTAPSKDRPIGEYEDKDGCYHSISVNEDFWKSLADVGCAWDHLIPEGAKILKVLGKKYG